MNWVLWVPQAKKGLCSIQNPRVQGLGFEAPCSNGSASFVGVPGSDFQAVLVSQLLAMEPSTSQALPAAFLGLKP